MRPRRDRRPALRARMIHWSLVSLCAFAAAAAAQGATPPDTVRLRSLTDAAVAHDPRAGQLALDRRLTELALRNIAVEGLPALDATAQAQYQSDVTRVGVTLPGGLTIPTPPRDTYDASAGVEESLLDPSRSPRRAVERARLTQSEATVHTALYDVRRQVDDAFFDAALLEAQEAELDAAIASLDTQRRVAGHRVQAGAALAGDSAAIAAELLRRRQDRSQLEASRQAALGVLSDLSGDTLAAGAILALPDPSAQVARARAAGADAQRARPEYAQYAATRALLGTQEAAVAAADRPRVSAFARGGYGRPGLDMLNDQFEWYWLAGIRIHWAPFTWGTNGREQQSLAVQQQVVATEESAFRRSINRASTRATAQLDFLERALASDSAIVSLREESAREARARYGEGVITAADYVDRETDLLNARLTSATHRVQLAQARTNYLTLLGIEVP